MEGIGLLVSVIVAIYGFISLIFRVLWNIMVFIIRAIRGPKKTISRTIRRDNKGNVVTVDRITAHDD
jgi:phage-related protein